MADTGKDSQGSAGDTNGETSSAIVDVSDGPFGVGAGYDRTVAKMTGQPFNFLKNGVDAYDKAVTMGRNSESSSTGNGPSAPSSEVLNDTSRYSNTTVQGVNGNTVTTHKIKE